MLTVLVVLSLGVWRVTRFLVEDDLIDNQRLWLHRKLLGRWAVKDVGGAIVPDPMAEHDGEVPAWRLKLYTLSQCPYCVSVWIALGAVALASWTWSVPQPFWSWLAVCGATMAWWKFIED